MDYLIRDAHYSYWINEASRTFKELEKKNFSKDINLISLSNEEPYLKELYRLIYISSKVSSIKDNIKLSLSNFLSFLLKSTIFIENALSLDPEEKKAKLSLIYGDLYLAQSGIEFTKIENFYLLNKESKKTLYNIALSQKLEGDTISLNYNNFKKIVIKRYGSIFRLAIKSQLIMNNITKTPKAFAIYYPDNIALLTTLENNEHLDPLLSSSEKTKKISIIKINLKKIERRFEEDGLYSDGWQESFK